jgi:radical SAM-linked protein
MRIRINFAKTEAMRYTSHLDLHRAWERTFRRAELPLTYTQGFSPHPRINLASALPLGFTSQHEIVDIWLDGELPIETIEAALYPAVPPGIQLISVSRIQENARTLQLDLIAAEYIITLLDPIPHLDARIQELLAASDISRQRRGKMYDLRPLIFDMHILPADTLGNQRLFVRLSACAGATGRPEEVLDALGASQNAMRAHRTGLVFTNPESQVQEN